MIKLPENYTRKMKALLKDEYDAYLSSFEQPHAVGLRVNTNKISVEEFVEKFPYRLEPVPWTNDGFYCLDDVQIAKHPFYYAGLFYIQEPSAMLPGQSLPIEEGDKVLDLCAAPGGKTTKLACSLHDTGVLFANDISVSRCQVLLRNMERFGVRNGFVMSENPKKLETYFPSYFDKILVDAPCSGQGMFRKEHALIHSYEERDESYFAPLQKEILTSALKMLKPGGQLVYSTCTFAPEEDEEVIQYALQSDPDLAVIPLPVCEGFVQNTYGTKLFPHRIKGEGHFVTLLQKGTKQPSQPPKHKQDEYHYDTLNLHLHDGTIVKRENKQYYVPDTGIDLKGLRLLRTGLFLGEEKKNRFEISPSLALALKEEECTQILNLAADDPRVIHYLKGETLNIKEDNLKDGHVLVCVDHHPLGLAKVTKGTFKNKYPKAWLYH